MMSVTERIKKVDQPRGGYIKPSEFTAIKLNDDIKLHAEENIHGNIIGLVVDYLTRFIIGSKIEDAFKISLEGAEIAERVGVKNATITANEFLSNIKGIDEKSIVNACKLVTFDVWLRNIIGAAKSKNYNEINPDKKTCENIQILIKRSVSFFEEYGPITKNGFTFEPETHSIEEYQRFKENKTDSYGGYTNIVSSGDGDFLTADTLWDFKVSKKPPTSKNTLQLLIYWVMGQHSGQSLFKNITKLGFFNPRLNTVYLFDISQLSPETIKFVEEEIICYPK